MISNAKLEEENKIIEEKYKGEIVFTNCPYQPMPTNWVEQWDFTLCSENCGPSAIAHRTFKLKREGINPDDEQICQDLVETTLCSTIKRDCIPHGDIKFCPGLKNVGLIQNILNNDISGTYSEGILKERIGSEMLANQLIVHCPRCYARSMPFIDIRDAVCKRLVGTKKGGDGWPYWAQKCDSLINEKDPQSGFRYDFVEGEMLTSDDEPLSDVDPLSVSNNGNNGQRPTQSNDRSDEFEDILTPKTKNQQQSFKGEADSDNYGDYRNNMTEEVNVDLNTEYKLQVDISDALSERDKVKYTVHTKTDMPEFAKREMSVVREHDEFIWLHDSLETNEEYAGFMIPPAPPRPDFDASREKLQKLGEGESTMTKEEFIKMKQELEQEYLATFKKTVAMHEVFLCRLAAHPIFCQNANFRIFLEYDNELSVRSKNKKEIVGSFFKRVSQSADEVLLSGQKDIDEFFEHEKNYLLEYHSHIKDATAKADRVCRSRKNVAESYAKIASSIEKIGQTETNGGNKEFGMFLYKVSDVFERLKKAESRVGTDEELKEADTLRYFTRETQAAKDLLYRRLRCLANYEGANKALERARARSRDIPKAEQEQADACKKFEDIVAVARGELVDLKKRRVEAFHKNLSELVDLEVKQSKNKLMILQSALESLRNTSTHSLTNNAINFTHSPTTNQSENNNEGVVHSDAEPDSTEPSAVINTNVEVDNEETNNKEFYIRDTADEHINKTGIAESTPPLVSNPLSSDLNGNTSD